jgi:YD repeat-containing protein
VSLSAQNRYKYEYNPEGRLLNVRSYSNNKLLWTEQYRYEPNKTTVTRRWEHEGKVEVWTNALFWTFILTYDDRGNLISEECSYDKLEDKMCFTAPPATNTTRPAGY